MKTLYFECNMGAAGDMLCASLLELLPNKKTYFDIINSLQIPNLSVIDEKSEKCGIIGTHLNVLFSGKDEEEHSHEHHNAHHHHDHHEQKHEHEHNSLDHIKETINSFAISNEIKSNANSIYKILAQAESIAHGKPIDEIHFHEVGTFDAIVDIVSFCILIDIIKPEKILSSPINVGSGNVLTSHGILPVPAPATANILIGVPFYQSEFNGELCTPTGAAILKHFVNDFIKMPLIKVSKIGYGMGKKDFESANCVRSYLGETADSENDKILILSCNLDDDTGENLGYVSSILMSNGALDVSFIPILMKKSRPGYILQCMCKEVDKEKISLLILKFTKTIGIRISEQSRMILSSHFETKSTPYGKIRLKVSEGYGIRKEKPEFDDLINLAKTNNLTIEEITNLIK